MVSRRWAGNTQSNQKVLTVVLLSYGDPYMATTHIELRTRAELENIETKTVTF